MVTRWTEESWGRLWKELKAIDRRWLVRTDNRPDVSIKIEPDICHIKTSHLITTASMFSPPALSLLSLLLTRDLPSLLAPPRAVLIAPSYNPRNPYVGRQDDM